ncbi:MAG: hypothetical protein WCI04_05845 [archaeon]
MELNLEQIQREEERRNGYVSTPEIENILKNPNILELGIKEVQKNVVGEEDTISVMGLCTCGRLVQNSDRTSYNLMPNDDSGTGKDYITKQVCQVFVPSHRLEILSRISAHVLTYWHSEDEAYSFDERVIVLIDVSQDLLDSTTLKTYLSNEQKAVILDKQKVRELIIRGKPVIFITTAHSIPNDEFLRRINIINLDASSEQTKRIKSHKAKLSIKGKEQSIDSNFRGAMALLNPIKVCIPFAEKIENYFPDSTITRTRFGTFLDFIRASTALHQYQREKNDEGLFIATSQDYEIARNVFNKLSQSSDLIPITKNQSRICQEIQKLDDSVVGAQKNLQHYLWSGGEIENKCSFITHKNFYANLGKLVNEKYLEKGEKSIVVSSSEEEGNKREVKRNVGAYRLIEKNAFNLPDWNQISKNDTNDTNDTHDTHNTDDTQTPSVS